MKVTSPVGEFPFELTGISVVNRRVKVYGAMGAWPSQIELEPRDFVQPVLLRALTPLWLFLALALTARSLARSRTKRNP
jgi:hypothetical protein